MGIEMFSLKGKVAVVTGGSRGFGKAITLGLGCAGADIVVASRTQAELEKVAEEIRAKGQKALAIATDTTNLDSIRSLAAKVMEAFGKIDILVNNAGIAGMNVPTVDYPIEEWERVFKVNLTSQFLTCRAIAPQMVKQKYGRIVNIASIAGKEGNPNAVAYSASKAGVISLTKSLGKELAKDGVTVNCVTPAAARTAIFDQMTEQHIQYMLSKIPMGRFVLVEEVAALVCWLASEDCAFSTGAVFDISGGRATY